jgi:putative membrane protein
VAQNFLNLFDKKSFMKKNYLMLGTCLLAATIWSCSNNTSSGSSADTTTTTSTTTVDTMHAKTDTSMHANTPSTSNANMNTTPLSKPDSTFVMEAAIGSMMEVEAGNLAQQNASSQRVKDYGAMMVRDHGQANNELKSLVSSRGIMLPDSLPAAQRKHIESMRKMTGKSFDSHYISMMKDDHRKDIGKFEKEANSGKDADIKNWASKTLPTLKMHRDSIEAISKAKM